MSRKSEHGLGDRDVDAYRLGNRVRDPLGLQAARCRRPLEWGNGPDLRGALAVMKRLLWLAALAFRLGVALPSFAESPGNFSTLSTTGIATMGGDVLMCSGRPWIDVRCNGATGDDSHDDTAAINT